MTRLDELKRELEEINYNMPCLSYDCKAKCREYLENEIKSITVYGSDNPELGKE